MTQAERERQLCNFVSKLVGESVSSDTALVEEGLIDSFQFIEILTFIEQRYTMLIDPTELNTEDFTSVSALLNMLERIRPDVT